MSKKPVMLCIMDGFGWTPDQTYGNAVAAANKPNLDKILSLIHSSEPTKQAEISYAVFCLKKKRQESQTLPG